MATIQSNEKPIKMKCKIKKKGKKIQNISWVVFVPLVVAVVAVAVMRSKITETAIEIDRDVNILMMML